MKIVHGYLVGIALTWIDNDEEIERLGLMYPVPPCVLEHFSDADGVLTPVYDDVAIPLAQQPVIINRYKNHVRVCIGAEDGYVIVGTVEEFLEVLKKYENTEYMEPMHIAGEE